MNFNPKTSNKTVSADTPEADLDALLMALEVPCGCASFQGGDDGGQYGRAAGCPDCGGSGVRHPLRKDCWTDCAEHPNGIFNPDPNTLFDAIRAKGWGIVIGDFPSNAGAWVQIYGDELEQMTWVELDEGIRGLHAVKLALARAMNV